MAISPSKTRVITFGCRLNSYESSIILGNAQACADQDTIVVNTCAVTAELKDRHDKPFAKPAGRNQRPKLLSLAVQYKLPPKLMQKCQKSMRL